MDGSRPISHLADSPAPPCSQQDNKIKQEPKTPIAPKKAQVCRSLRWENNFISHIKPDCPSWFLFSVLHFGLFFKLDLVFLFVSFLFIGGQDKEHGFLGQPGSKVPVHTGVLGALFKRQLWKIQAGREREGGERETAESTGWTGQEGAREATVSGRLAGNVWPGKRVRSCNPIRI